MHHSERAPCLCSGPAQGQKPGSTRCGAHVDGWRGRDRADGSSFPEEARPELSQSGKPRGGNTQHKGKFKSTYTQLGV